MTRHRSEIELLEPQAAMYRAAVPYNLVIGAQGSGKSHDIGVRSGLFLIYCPNVVGLIAANTYDQLSRATMKEAFAAWKKYFGWTEYHPKSNPHGHFVFGKMPPPHFKPHGYTLITNNNNIYFSNGGVIFTASLDNYKAIEGIQIGWALLDETADTAEEAVTEVITGRLRQTGLCTTTTAPWAPLFPYAPKGTKWAGKEVNPLYIYTKPAKVPWLKDLFKLDPYEEEIKQKIYRPGEYFYHCDGYMQVCIYSVYHNEHNLPENFIQNRAQLLAGSGLIDSYIYGNPFAKTGGEFASEFDKKKHQVRCEYEDGYPIHLSVDFNAKPYMSGIIAQLVEYTEDGYWAALRIFDEYALEWPNNTAGHLGEGVTNDYSDLSAYGLYVYGDASGNNSIPIKGAKSFFDDLINNLKIPHELRVPASNPKYKAALGPGTMGRKAFLNRILSGAAGVKVEISPKCQRLLGDLEFVMEDANGAMKKTKNKEGVEERGHHLDALQYLICHPKFLGYLAKIPTE